MNNIYKQIRMRRKHLGISQKDFEELIDMKQTQYQRIEAGGNVKIKTLERILKILKLKMILVPQERIDIILPFLTEEESQGLDQPLSLLERYEVVDDE